MASGKPATPLAKQNLGLGFSPVSCGSILMGRSCHRAAPTGFFFFHLSADTSKPPPSTWESSSGNQVLLEKGHHVPLDF